MVDISDSYGRTISNSCNKWNQRSDYKVSYTPSVQGVGADKVASKNTYIFHVK